MESSRDGNKPNWLRWNWTSDEIKSCQQEKKKEFTKMLDEMINMKKTEVRTKKNTIDKLANFEYELYNPIGEVATVAKTTLVFVDCSTGKPCLIPDNFKSKIKTYFS